MRETIEKSHQYFTRRRPAHFEYEVISDREYGYDEAKAM
jgi:hypothetical protein